MNVNGSITNRRQAPSSSWPNLTLGIQSSPSQFKHGTSQGRKEQGDKGNKSGLDQTTEKTHESDSKKNLAYQRAPQTKPVFESPHWFVSVGEMQRLIQFILWMSGSDGPLSLFFHVGWLWGPWVTAVQFCLFQNRWKYASVTWGHKAVKLSGITVGQIRSTVTAAIASN